MPIDYHPRRYYLGGVIFILFPPGSSMPLCVHFLVWLVNFLVLDSLVHKLNTVQHEMLHLWRTSVACWIVLVKPLLCLIFSPILSWKRMPYGIFSVPFMVLFTIRLIYVEPMMLGRLAYCEWLFLSLAEILVCGCNKILQICGCSLIGGEKFLIFLKKLDWLLLAVVICPTTECVSLYISYIVLLWSDFRVLNR